MVLIVISPMLLQNHAQEPVDCPESAHLGGHCFTPSELWESDGTCVQVKQRRVCHVPRSRDFKFTLRVSVRQLRIGKANSRPLDNLYIRGRGPGLSWDKSVMLKRSAKGVGLWVTQIGYKSDSKGRLCEERTHCLSNQNRLEFRVYQDAEGKHDMLGPNLYVELPVSHSMFGHQHFIMPTVDVHPWFGGRAITVEELVLSNLPSPLHAQLLYPPSFDYNVRKKYPVVILFGTGEGLRISPLLESMFTREASIEEVFVINIYVNDSAPFCALSPYTKANAGSVNSIWKCKQGKHCRLLDFCWLSKCDRESFVEGTKTYLHPVKCSGVGEAMLDAIEHHLLPMVKIKVGGRLLVEFPQHRLSVIGYDGAGLLACHAAISRSHMYQNAACMSAPFHWPLNVALSNKSTPLNCTGISRAMKNISREFLYYPERRFFHVTQKFFIDYGEMDNHHFPVIDTAQYVDWFIDRLQVEFAVPPHNVFLLRNVLRSSNNYFLRSGAGTEIMNRVKMPLLFFFGAKGGPNANFPDLTKSVSSDEKSASDDEAKSKEIPQECIQEFKLFNKKMVGGSSNIPVQVLGFSIGKIQHRI